jgi:hypothetical protein
METAGAVKIWVFYFVNFRFERVSNTNQPIIPRDVTEDIARAALSKAQNERRSIAWPAQEFLERTLGVDAATDI